MQQPLSTVGTPEVDTHCKQCMQKGDHLSKHSALKMEHCLPPPLHHHCLKAHSPVLA